LEKQLELAKTPIKNKEEASELEVEGEAANV
jgi:hypothetical protein